MRRLLAQGPTWTDAQGTRRPLAQDDILILTPYNAQVAALTASLPGLRISTVDKFQGQEVPGTPGATCPAVRHCAFLWRRTRHAWRHVSGGTPLRPVRYTRRVPVSGGGETAAADYRGA